MASRPDVERKARESFKEMCGFDTATGCWPWEGALTSKGYGYVRDKTDKKRMLRAHRVSWELFCGPIPKGLCVLHKCDVPRCVNPEHLFVGSQLDNIRDCNKKGRQAKGARQGNSKLTESDVHNIRSMREAGLTYQQIADSVGCSRWTVRGIVARTSWVHV